MAMTARTPMVEVDWFKGCGTLAIADVVYVEGIGLCSHQPDGSSDGHRMMDVTGRIHFVSTDRLFQASEEEVNFYWGPAAVGIT